MGTERHVAEAVCQTNYECYAAAEHAIAVEVHDTAGLSRVVAVKAAGAMVAGMTLGFRVMQ